VAAWCDDCGGCCYWFHGDGAGGGGGYGGVYDETLDVERKRKPTT